MGEADARLLGLAAPAVSVMGDGAYSPFKSGSLQNRPKFFTESNPGYRMSFLQKIIAAGGLLLLGSVLVIGAGNLLAGEETCYTKSNADPKTTYCLVEEEPIDLQVENWHEDPHDVSIRVSEGSDVIYSETVTVNSPEGVTIEDVIRSPGEYHVQATLETGENDSMTMTVEERHCLECVKLVRVTSDGDLWVATPPRG